MGVILNHNMSALSAYNNLRKSQSRVDGAMERLSSGLRINRAADDAAGLAISETLRTQVNGLEQASRNAQDGVSVMQTADGGLNETHAILQRMRTLAVQAANGTNSADNRRQIQTEMNQLMAEIDHVADGVEFNGMSLLDGSFHEKKLQIGANAGDTMEVTIGSLKEAPVPPEPPAFAVWNIDKAIEAQDPSLNPFVVTSTVGEGASVSVALEPFPGNIDELVDRLRNDPVFDAAFTVQTGSIRVDSQGIDRPAANLIIEAREPGEGSIAVGAIPVAATDTPDGATQPGTTPADEFGSLYGRSLLGKPEEKAQYGGYHANEILLGPIDVTREAGSRTTTITEYPSPGGTYTQKSKGFGSAVETTVIIPATEGRTYDSTETWGSGAEDAIGIIDRAIAIVSRGRGDVGAYQNRLEHTMTNLSVGAENMAASEARIRDADMAKQAVELTRGQILSQAGTAMLAQANQTPQSILRLLPNS